MKGPRKRVLVDVGCSIKPEQELNVEASVVIHDDLRLPESRGGLEGLVLLKKKFTGQSRQVDLTGWIAFL